MKRKADAQERDTENRANEHPGNVAMDEGDVDQVLADSFPASDPPPWTFGVKPAVSKTLRHRKRERRDR